MTPTALALVLIAAVLHTSWNLLLKRASERQLITWWSLLVGSLVFVPTLVWAWPLPILIWPYLLASALVEAAYMTLLSHAYQHGDFSLVYPIARGTAPLLLTVWAGLFLREWPGPGGLLGIVVLLCGLALIGADQWWANRTQARVGWLAVGMALTIAVCISIYSTIDAAAVRLADPLAYNTLCMLVTALCMAPFTLRRSGPSNALLVLRTHWPLILLIGTLMLGTYALVLTAYSFTTASYVGAVRELSIVLAALAGWRLLGEHFGKLRMVGALLTFVGVLLIATLGN